MNGPAQPASLGDIVEIQSTFATQKEIKSAMIALRLAPSLKQAAEKAAAEDSRTLTSLVQKALKDYLAARGYVVK
ncbi:MAG: hypothetical protein JWN93_3780 [Hyphomicrobiales bacterium]|nr:hypothetical protein [Hyphomicrobiales bacterium]